MSRLKKRHFAVAFLVCVSLIVLMSTINSDCIGNVFLGQRRKTSSPTPSLSNVLEVMKRPPDINGTQKSDGANSNHEQDILSSVKKLPFRVVAPSPRLMKDRYYTPSKHVLEVYENCVLQQPKGICRDSTSLLVLIPSRASDASVRQAIRETWASFAQGKKWPRRSIYLRTNVVFVVGIQNVTGSSKYFSQKMDNAAVHKTSENCAFDEAQMSATGPDLTSEIRSFDDILMFDMKESYRNLTRKLILSLKWGISSCTHVKYILKVDQDIFVNMPLLTTFLKFHGENNTVYGHIYPKSFVRREGNWAVPRSALPVNEYPIYASGNAYVLSRDATEKIVRLSSHYPYIPIEDAFITGILASVAKVNRVHVQGFTAWRDTRPDACDFVNDLRYTGNGMREDDHRRIWRDLINWGSGRCGN